MAPFSRSRRAMFGAPMAWDAPPFAGDNGASPDAAPIARDAAVPTQAGMFNPRKRTFLDKVGLLSDAFQGSDRHAQALAQQDDQDREFFLAQQGPEQKFAQWKRQFDYERAHPAAPNNDTVSDYNFRVQTLGKEAADAWLRSAGDPDIALTLPGNRFYSGPRSGLAAALSGGNSPAPTRPAIGTEIPDPRKRGGAPSQGGGTFPDPLKGPGRVTSMRRTAQGNAAVGGVGNSRHLTGEAVDVVGASPAALRAFYGPQARFLDEGNHIHVTVPGARFPYYGRNGTRGLR